MNYDQILSHTNFFKDTKKIKEIDKISNNKLRIRTDDNKDFVLGLYEIDDHDNIEKENYIIDRLRDIGMDPLEIYEDGLLPDIKKSYKIFDYRKEESLKDFLETCDEITKYNLGYKFGKILKKLHSIKINIDTDWEKEFRTKTNYLLYTHGNSEFKSDDDYILIDFIKAKIHLTKNTSSNLLYNNLNFKNIRVYDGDKLDLRAIKDFTYGDCALDFVEINKIAIYHKQFSKGVMDGYFDPSKPLRKFLRLLSLYQAYIVLSNKIHMDDIHNLSENEIKEILEMYDNFSTFIPSWM